LVIFTFNQFAILIKLNLKKAIVWDWNGTLLDDIAVCVECMNVLLKKRNLPKLTFHQYKKIFTFPVRDYYLAVGFDFSKEPFKVPAMEFMDLYLENLPRAFLYPDVKNVLNFLNNKGFRQSILSAMEHNSLIASLKDFDLLAYFDKISGIDNHYAHSKLEIGRELIGKIGFREEEMLIIGDSLHDLEVAEELGVDCLLIANGHQSKARLLDKTPHVLSDLKEVIDLFN